MQGRCLSDILRPSTSLRYAQDERLDFLRTVRPERSEAKSKDAILHDVNRSESPKILTKKEEAVALREISSVQVPAGQGAACTVRAGQYVRVVDVEGGQVADFNAWTLP